MYAFRFFKYKEEIPRNYFNQFKTVKTHFLNTFTLFHNTIPLIKLFSKLGYLLNRLLDEGFSSIDAVMEVSMGLSSASSSWICVCRTNTP